MPLITVKVISSNAIMRQAASPDGGMILCQAKQGPVATFNDFGAALLLDGRESEVEVEDGENAQHAAIGMGLPGKQWRVHDLGLVW